MVAARRSSPTRFHPHSLNGARRRPVHVEVRPSRCCRLKRDLQGSQLRPQSPEQAVELPSRPARLHHAAERLVGRPAHPEPNGAGWRACAPTATTARFFALRPPRAAGARSRRAAGRERGARSTCAARPRWRIGRTVPTRSRMQNVLNRSPRSRPIVIVDPSVAVMGRTSALWASSPFISVRTSQGYLVLAEVGLLISVSSAVRWAAPPRVQTGWGARDSRPSDVATSKPSPYILADPRDLRYAGPASPEQ